jgi:DNA-binding MarR family transcriptional regulator
MDDFSPDLNEYGVLPLLAKTRRCADVYINKRLQLMGVGLTLKQIVVLKSLALDGPLPQSSLAFCTDRDKASLARFVNTLEKKNLLARIPSKEDKRVNLVHLTASGEKVFNEALPVFKKIILEVQEGISQEELNQVSITLSKLRSNINSLKNSCTSN